MNSLSTVFACALEIACISVEAIEKKSEPGHSSSLSTKCGNYERPDGFTCGEKQQGYCAAKESSCAEDSKCTGLGDLFLTAIVVFAMNLLIL